ncbi:MAG: hypothetical protein AAF357_19990, partial [Verrucomicrobiota bacterium]
MALFFGVDQADGAISVENSVSATTLLTASDPTTSFDITVNAGDLLIVTSVLHARSGDGYLNPAGTIAASFDGQDLGAPVV